MSRKLSSSCTPRYSLQHEVRYITGPFPKEMLTVHPRIDTCPSSAAVETAPFEVTDMGWGEFEVMLQVFFHDSREKPLELTHMLKLYPDGDTGQQGSTKPVVSERYDEFVFNNPSDGLRQRLLQEVVPSAKGWRHSSNAKWLTDYDNEAPQDSLQQVYQVITAELQTASKRRRLLEEELAQHGS